MFEALPRVDQLKLSLYFFMQRCGFSLEPSPNLTSEATFSPDGQYVVSGEMIPISLLFIFYVNRYILFVYFIIYVVVNIATSLKAS